ncbi:hypothetical protein LLH23_21140 [bacterium]|nr:hypothetical protein [bacterium]
MPSVGGRTRTEIILRVALVVAAASLAVALSGCAYGGAGGGAPSVVVDFYVRMAGTINDAFYYFIPIDADGDDGDDGPVPVAAGPYWENGWGTGSFTHYIEYHQGQYTLFRVNCRLELRNAGGGITAVGGTPTGSTVGVSTLTVQSVSFGAVTVSGTGMVASVANASFQAAGTLTLATNAAGEVVAGSVVFAPAASGGRALTAAEQSVITNLNAGGVALQADSLSGLGLTLTLNAAQAGTQTLTIAPTTATVQNRFEPESGSTETTTGTLQANTVNGASNTVIPGGTITAADFVQGGTATVRKDLSTVGTSLGPPYQYTLPSGGTILRATVDVSSLGDDIPDLSINVITTNELIFDESITDPDQHTYDGLGRLGNRYVTFPTDQYQTISNSSGLFEQETSGDSTLTGPATAEERNQVDIVDWSITIRRLQ